MGKITSIGKFRVDNRTIMNIIPGVSANGVIYGGASAADFQDGKIVIDLNALSSKNNTTGALHITGFNTRLRIIDASYQPIVALAGTLRVFTSSVASVATALTFVSNASIGKTIVKPTIHTLANNVIDAGGFLTIKGNKKAGKGLLVINVEPY